MTGRRAGVFAVALLTVLSSCGINAEDSPRAISVGVDDAGLSVDRADGGRAIEIATSIYLVTESGSLRPTVRSVRVSAQPSTHLSSVLDALIDGPSDAEAANGLGSAVPSTTEVLAVTVDGDTALVDLSEDFAAIGGERELRAVGQLVLTVTTFPGVRQVMVRLNGRPTDLQLPDGSFADGPVALSDYAPLLDPETATATSSDGG